MFVLAVTNHRHCDHRTALSARPTGRDATARCQGQRRRRHAQLVQRHQVNEASEAFQARRKISDNNLIIHGCFRQDTSYVTSRLYDVLRVAACVHVYACS